MSNACGPYRTAPEPMSWGTRASILVKGFSRDVFSPRVAASKLMLEVSCNLSERSGAIERILKSGSIEDVFAVFKETPPHMQPNAASALVSKITKKFESLVHDAQTSESNVAGYFGLKRADVFLSVHKEKVRSLVSSGMVQSPDALTILNDFVSS
ncbi:hypothetical protein HY990_06585 [Candidatus Micrarchaeota archaeon]|nr:hypothetical protein [Candidatus Micrarchaeota archaeon]